MLRRHSHDGRQTSSRRIHELKSAVQKRSIVIGGHKTSVSLEDAFWGSLKAIAGVRGTTLSEVVADIDARRGHGNLSSAIRLFVLDHYRAPDAAGDGATLAHHASGQRPANETVRPSVKG
jgi:predicted DNA-binding ribbon-helix-helix protein